MASGLSLMQVKPAKGSWQLPQMCWTWSLLAAISNIKISGLSGTSQKPPMLERTGINVWLYIWRMSKQNIT